MSTQRRNSAIFAEVSGPHCCPFPWNTAYRTGLWGLGMLPDGTHYQSPVPGGNYSDYRGLWERPGWWLVPGQVGKFIVVAQVGRLSSREALEAALETRGLWTKSLWIQQGGGQATWELGPRDRKVTSDVIVRAILDAVAATSQAQVLTYMPAPPTWDHFATIRQGDVQGLGDIFTSLAGRSLRFTADMVCAPAFAASAAQSIAERYGEDQARQFRQHLHQAQAFCREGAVDRQRAVVEADKKRQTYWALGLVAAALGGIVLWNKLGKKGNRSRRRRRNVSAGRARQLKPGTQVWVRASRGRGGDHGPLGPSELATVVRAEYGGEYLELRDEDGVEFSIHSSAVTVPGTRQGSWRGEAPPPDTFVPQYDPRRPSTDWALNWQARVRDALRQAFKTKRSVLPDEAIVSTMRSKAGWVEPDPRVVYLFTEYGLGDPLYRSGVAAGLDRAVAILRRGGSSGASWESYRPGVVLFTERRRNKGAR